MKKSKYLIAPENWSIDDINPFNDSGLYYSDFSSIFFTDDDDDRYINGTSTSGLYNVVMHKNVDHMDQKVADFIHYENYFNRSVILASNYELNIERYIESIQDDGDLYKIRDSDPEYLVHSTNLIAWKSIQEDYFLKSSSQLDSEKINYISIGFQELKEPKEYRDFIMFGGFGYHPEFIVLSQQKGKIVTDKDCAYEPGVRIYLDCHKMIKDRIIFRDGLHKIKVKSKLDLKKYMIDSATIQDIDNNNSKIWTPESFARECDKYFIEQTQKIGNSR